LDSDRQLLHRIKAGDRAALSVLYDRYLPSVWRYVYSQLQGDDQACRDVVSETFLAAIRNLTRGNAPVDSVGGWLIGIARHKLTDSRRLAMKQVDIAPLDVASVEHDPVTALEAADTRRVLGRVMEQMDAAERTVLEWKYIEELSVRDIARRLNRTCKVVEATLYRARNSFRALYEKAREPEL
jgi:RNA polymerase sigma factor (sigma-70 family)